MNDKTRSNSLGKWISKIWTVLFVNFVFLLLQKGSSTVRQDAGWLINFMSNKTSRCFWTTWRVTLFSRGNKFPLHFAWHVREERLIWISEEFCSSAAEFPLSFHVHGEVKKKTERHFSTFFVCTWQHFAKDEEVMEAHSASENNENAIHPYTATRVKFKI